MTIEEAAKKLESEHKNKRWFYMIGVGAATNTIYLYVHTLKATPAYLKDMKEYEGYRLFVAKMAWASPA